MDIKTVANTKDYPNYVNFNRKNNMMDDESICEWPNVRRYLSS
jgi:hypothetical protein